MFGLLLLLTCVLATETGTGTSTITRPSTATAQTPKLTTSPALVGNNGSNAGANTTPTGEQKAGPLSKSTSSSTSASQGEATGGTLTSTLDAGRDSPLLTKDQIITISVTVGVGFAALVVAILAWLFPRTRNAENRKEFTYRFSRAAVDHKRLSDWRGNELK